MFAFSPVPFEALPLNQSIACRLNFARRDSAAKFESALSVPPDERDGESVEITRLDDALLTIKIKNVNDTKTCKREVYEELRQHQLLCKKL